jgi:hypothetical protein
VLHAAAAALVACGVGALLFALGRRAIARPAPWPLRARTLYPIRVAMIAFAWILPIAVAVVLARDESLHGAAPALAAGAAAAATLASWRYRLTRLVVGPDYTLRRALRGALTRALVIHAHLWVALAFAVLTPPGPPVESALVLAAGVALLVLIVRGGGIRAAQALGLAPPAPTEIVAPVRDAAARQGLRLGGVHQIDLPEANAYALPFGARVAFTRPALWKLTLQSLLAIAEHELAHLREPARSRWARAAGLAVLLPIMGARVLLAAGGAVALLAALVLALVLGRAVQRHVIALETRADAGAKDAEPGAGAYAHALEELHRLSLMPAVVRGSTHPDLYDRLLALGVEPSYPRPPPPPRGLAVPLGALLAVAVLAAGAWGEPAAVAAARRGHAWLALALDGDGRQAGAVALALHAEGRYADAATFYAAAAEMERHAPHWPAYAAMSLAAARRTSAADEALAEAERRASGRPERWADLLAEARRRVANAR